MTPFSSGTGEVRPWQANDSQRRISSCLGLPTRGPSCDMLRRHHTGGGGMPGMPCMPWACPSRGHPNPPPQV